MKQLILILLFISNLGYTQNWDLDENKCYDDYPTYYSNKKVFIYQNQSINSAIIGEIPYNSSVKVTNSFFGDLGWWKICYEGKEGWVKKNLLSYKKSSNQVKSNTNNQIITNTTNYENEDIGFNPFLGRTTSNVNIRSKPSSQSYKIKTLPSNSTIYVYSDKSINNYYKAIDVMSSKIGWIHKSYVSFDKKININEKGVFQSTGYTSSYNSEVKITNKSAYEIKLVIDKETFTLRPNSIKTIKTEPGRKYYIATAPGVIPASGYQYFESNNGYKWQFWVNTTRR